MRSRRDAGAREDAVAVLPDVTPGVPPVRPEGSATTSDDATSSTPAAAISSRAATPCSGVTGAVRSVSTRTRSPAFTASSAVALTQCDSASPTTSTAVICRSRRIVASGRSSASTASNPE